MNINTIVLKKHQKLLINSCEFKTRFTAKKIIPHNAGYD